MGSLARTAARIGEASDLHSVSNASFRRAASTNSISEDRVNRAANRYRMCRLHRSERRAFSRLAYWYFVDEARPDMRRENRLHFSDMSTPAVQAMKVTSDIRGMAKAVRSKPILYGTMAAIGARTTSGMPA